MDIAKYIGLFILKNKFCYVPGLGNIELKRTPSAFTGEALTAPSYEIVMSSVGSIDDSLANFIATNEKISIASASNAVRSFVTETKAALHEGKQVALPSLGVFTETSGKIQFTTDPAFKYTPQAIPTVKYAAREMPTETRKVTAKSAPAYKANSSETNWGRIAIIVVVSGILLAAVVKGISYLYRNEATEPAQTEAAQPAATQPTPAPAPVQQPTQPIDTTAKDSTKLSPVPPPMATTVPAQENIKVIIGTYKTKSAAERRVHQFAGMGKTVEMVAKDSTTFYIVMPVTTTTANKEHALDSLRKLYSPKGVSILQ